MYSPIEILNTCEQVGLRPLFKDMERKVIVLALGRTNGCVAQAARLLKVKRTALVMRMQGLGIDRPMRRVD